MAVGNYEPTNTAHSMCGEALRSDLLGAESAISTCVSRVMRNSMRQMLEIGIEPSALPGALLNASSQCRLRNFDGASVQQLKSPELAFALEDSSWKTPA